MIGWSQNADSQDWAPRDGQRQEAVASMIAQVGNGEAIKFDVDASTGDDISACLQLSHLPNVNAHASLLLDDRPTSMALHGRINRCTCRIG